MGENRNRIIWLENDVQDLKKGIQGLRDELAEATDFSTDITAQNEAIEGLGETIGLFQDQIRALGAQVQALVGSNNYLVTQHAKEWLSEMQHTCRQVSDSVTSIHAWQNQMAKDFSKAISRIVLADNRIRDIEASRLKLSALADERMADLERQLDEATRDGRAAVSRMEQLETRLRKLEETQVRVTLGPKTVHIPETIHMGGPVSVKMDPSIKREADPRQIQCRPFGYGLPGYDEGL